MKCPKCSEFLPRLAQSCACGWKRVDSSAEALPWINCAHETCTKPAIVKLKTETGWVKLCESHYTAHFQEPAEQTCVKLGLLTPGMCREWLRANVGRIGRMPDKRG